MLLVLCQFKQTYFIGISKFMECVFSDFCVLQGVYGIRVAEGGTLLKI
jgi:hypothetical protein